MDSLSGLSPFFANRLAQFLRQTNAGVLAIPGMAKAAVKDSLKVDQIYPITFEPCRTTVESAGEVARTKISPDGDIVITYAKIVSVCRVNNAIDRTYG